MVFSVTVLGSNAAVPTLTRNPSAHLLNANERLFLFDCAEGTQLRLRQYKIHFQRINHIFISHNHGDHYYGLIGLLTTFHLLGRKNDLHVYAIQPLEEIIRIQLEASRTRLSYLLHFVEFDPDKDQVLFEDQRVTVSSFPLIHSVPASGFIVREKIKVRKQPHARSYAYCTDTIFNRGIIPHIHGVDLLYHETTFKHDMIEAAHEKMHATTIEAATIAKEAEVKQLMIGHFSARYKDLEPLREEASGVFSNTILAEDGKTVNI